MNCHIPVVTLQDLKDDQTQSFDSAHPSTTKEYKRTEKTLILQKGGR
jgi:hypothetical protein